MKFLIGIDEAGRAPLAGPVSVGLVMVPEGFVVAREFPGVKDSKQLSEKRREALYTILERRLTQGDIRFCVRFSTNNRIDTVGITRSVRSALFSGVRKLSPEPEGVHIQMDGLLKAPPAYSQETIVHGDDLVPLISLASIAAKVERDRLMRRMAKKYPEYGFERHVGYPTDYHRRMIRKHGLSPIHRRTFCKKFVAMG